MPQAQQIPNSLRLPYDMGNAGDLLKHGLLAEFTQWWGQSSSKPLRFLDPFAGLKWEQPRPGVTRRVAALPETCALHVAQNDPGIRYYGSSYVVNNTATKQSTQAEVFVSDGDQNAVQVLLHESPFHQLAAPGFNPADGYSILQADIQGDLVLLDPFSDFLPRKARAVIPQIAEACQTIACVLFVLNLDPDNSVGRRYRDLRLQWLPDAWSLHCPTLPHGTNVRGESTYEVDVLLAWEPLLNHPHRNILRERLSRYAEMLTVVLDVPVTFSERFV